MVLDSGNVLTKVTPYRLQRSNGTLRIEIHQVISGSDTKFVAVPVDGLGMTSKRRDLHIQASAELEALEKIVSAVQSLTHEEVFPKGDE